MLEPYRRLLAGFLLGVVVFLILIWSGAVR